MKTLSLNLAVLLIFALGACSGGGSASTEDFTGEWKLTKIEKEGDAEASVTDCDKKTHWHFKDEKAEPLGDGTEVMKVVAKAPDNCKFYGFDSKWTTKDGKLFISSIKTGGMGGGSKAGLFDIKEHTDKKLVLHMMKTTFTLEKVK